LASAAIQKVRVGTFFALFTVVAYNINLPAKEAPVVVVRLGSTLN
jgi:hypothetical protein